MFNFHFHRPQRSWGKVMFLQASVILLTGGGGVCLSACWEHTPPPAADTLQSRPPWEQTPHWGAEIPPPQGADTPLEQTPPHRQTPPGADTPPA